jgi:hypothetical protein
MTSRGYFVVGAAAGALAATVFGGALQAIYMRPDLENVPVARLVSNLERELAADPKSADIHLRLARLYAMAYAANAEELPATVVAGRGSQDTKPQVWFGHEPDIIPADIKPGTPRTVASKTYLQKSVDHYGKVIELAPTSLVGRIGHGWTLEQSGNKAAAIAEYRRAIEQAWPKEQNARVAQLGQRFYTEEAARYLIPLLDPKRDEAEISELQKRTQMLARVPRPVTPIAIPLSDSATIKTIIDLNAGVAHGPGSRARRDGSSTMPRAAVRSRPRCSGSESPRSGRSGTTAMRPCGRSTTTATASSVDRSCDISPSGATSITTAVAREERCCRWRGTESKRSPAGSSRGTASTRPHGPTPAYDLPAGERDQLMTSFSGRP